MKTTIYTVLLATVISYSGVAAAAAADFTDNGNYTSDGLSNLDWLDVNVTTGRSYDQVKGLLGTPGSDLTIGTTNYGSGWHYATDQQLIDMVNHYTGASATDFGWLRIRGPLGFDLDGVRTAEIAEPLVNLLADEQPPGTGMTACLWAEGLMLDSTDPANALMGTVDACPGAGASTAEWSYPDHNVVAGTNGVAAINAGSFLVRDSVSAVPLPGTALLLAPALFGFIGFRRKLKA